MTEQMERLSQALVTDQSSTNTSLALDQSITSQPVHYQSSVSQAPSYSQSMTGTLPTHYPSITEDNLEDEPDEILYDFIEPEPVEPPQVKPEPPIAPPTVARRQPKGTPPEKVAEVIKLTNEGVSRNQIAKLLGIGRTTVHDILKRTREQD